MSRLKQRYESEVVPALEKASQRDPDNWEFHYGLAPVGFDKADDDIGATLEAAVALFEHLVGLSDPRSRAEVDPQLPGTHGTSSRQRSHRVGC